MNKERLQEIKDSVEFQKEILEAHNMNTLCVDEEQELLEEIERLQEDLEYSNHCNEELRKKITNLEYKIKMLEEDNIGERVLYHSEREVKEEYKDRIYKAIEYIKEKYIEDYSNNDNYIPLEQLNLKNCSWERSLQVLEILKGSDKE